MSLRDTTHWPGNELNPVHLAPESNALLNQPYNAKCISMHVTYLLCKSAQLNIIEVSILDNVNGTNNGITLKLSIQTTSIIFNIIIIIMKLKIIIKCLYQQLVVSWNVDCMECL